MLKTSEIANKNPSRKLSPGFDGRNRSIIKAPAKAAAPIAKTNRGFVIRFIFSL